MPHLYTSRRVAHNALALLLLVTPLFTVVAQQHSINQDIIDATGWFGGDDNPASPRNVAVGQSVLIDKAMTVESFAFHFGTSFDRARQPDNRGHEVTLVLHVRDANGSVLESSSVTLPDTFAGGWVTWTGLTRTVAAGSTLIFTAYLLGGFDDNPYTSSHGSSVNDTHPGGTRYVKEASSDAAMAEWSDWVTHPWDSAFRLAGTLLTTSSAAPPAAFPARIDAVFPQPVSGEGTLHLTLDHTQPISVEVYSVLGQRILVLAEGLFTAGAHALPLRVASLPRGVYRVLLRTSEGVSARTLHVM